MPEFMRYPHVERWGKPDVEGIELGECWVFPKLDGTNASLWVEDGVLRGGSRNRALTLDNDNHGFLAWATLRSNQDREAEQLAHFLFNFPQLRLFGEWLVPHTFKHYREHAWRRFWVFDVWDSLMQRWVPWEEYAPLLKERVACVVDPLARIKNPTEADLLKLVESNTYLVADGAPPGEGVVVKRYDFTNCYGRTAWAKLVRNEFKEENRQAFGVQERGGSYQAELDIAQRCVTQALVDKERVKVEHALLVENSQLSGEERESALRVLRGKLIPRLLETVYHCVVTEELWGELKRLKDPTLDFRLLRRAVQAEAKRCMGDLL